MSITLDPIFSDHMVLQREMLVPIWGTATPGEAITVSVQGTCASTVADDQGLWQCTLPPLAASNAETLTVEGKSDRICVHDVAVGEVFVAGGQSNMEFWMRYERHLPNAIKTCENPRIRFYDMPKCSYPGQLEDFDYRETRIWRKATPSQLERFSAIGYYLACELEKTLNVPVGIVGCNYGGTKSSAWMTPDHAYQVQKPQTDAFVKKLQGLDYDQLLAHGSLNPKNDKGYTTWPAWNEFFLPTTRTAEETAAFMEQEMEREAAKATSIAQDAQDAQADAAADELSSHPGILTPTKDGPGALYTHMVLPLAPYATRGILWYQGESDDEDPGAQACHREALRTVIEDWRAAWDNPKLPFFVVQLPGYRTWMGVDANDWPTIRAAQQDVSDAMDDVWLCSIADVGEELDIHPKNKLVPGHRLALLALRHLFGQDILADAPRCTEATRDGQTIQLSFSSAGDGLAILGTEVAALSVMYNDKSLPFTAQTEGCHLVITLDRDVTNKLTVRFAQENWYILNLINSAGIPALPFEVEVAERIHFC